MTTAGEETEEIEGAVTVAEEVTVSVELHLIALIGVEAVDTTTENVTTTSVAAVEMIMLGEEEGKGHPGAIGVDHLMHTVGLQLEDIGVDPQAV